jgi:hypothetical protein
LIAAPVDGSLVPRHFDLAQNVYERGEFSMKKLIFTWIALAGTCGVSSAQLASIPRSTGPTVPGNTYLMGWQINVVNKQQQAGSPGYPVLPPSNPNTGLIYITPYRPFTAIP